MASIVLPFSFFAAAAAPRRMTWPDYVALAAYFALSLAIGWWCAKRKKATSGGFFLGSGRIPWWAAAISFMATATSSISFMSLPARTYTSDWLAFGSAPAQVLAGIFVGIVFVGVLRRLELTTIFGYLERRFDRRVQLLGAGLGILLKVGGRMSVVMLLPSLALHLQSLEGVDVLDVPGLGTRRIVLRHRDAGDTEAVEAVATLVRDAASSLGQELV